MPLNLDYITARRQAAWRNGFICGVVFCCAVVWVARNFA